MFVNCNADLVMGERCGVSVLVRVEALWVRGEAHSLCRRLPSL